MQTILITGGAGFVGSNLAILLKEKYANYSIVCLDNLKRRGSELNANKLREHNIEFILGDVRAKSDFDKVEVPIHCVIDAAAEPSVLAGLDGNTDYVIGTNLNGTINALNFSLKNKANFIFLSTSRVYPIKAMEQIEVVETETRFEIAHNQRISGINQNGISESFPLSGARSLYGSTKLASELIVEEYNEMLGLKTVINRCGIITGPYQMGKIDQGVVVLWMAKHFWRQELLYLGYGGTGKQVRDMVHIKDLFDLIDVQIHEIDKFNGQTFNVGGGRKVSASLQELTSACQLISGNKISIQSIPQTRKADIRLYISDNTKINSITGWTPKRNVQEILEDIFFWIKNNEQHLLPILC